jgi:hypothetical protein
VLLAHPTSLHHYSDAPQGNLSGERNDSQS